tara:strand:+ start:8570 stop:9517 length:948 start_codon:yes stop_codon:yes gene_type:complete
MKQMKKHILAFAMINFGLAFNAQSQGSLSRPQWSVPVILSSSTFLSDLGGKDSYGSNDPADINFPQISYAFGAGIKYTLPKGINFELSAFYTRLFADDAETTSDRGLRKLKVRTDVIETALKIGYTFPQNSGLLRGFYANVGAGLMFFTPMGEYNGTWHKLRPLGTEGQNIDPNQQAYKVYSPAIPFGFGKKFALSNGMMLGIDLSMRRSFTDYLDDVSGNYFDNALIKERSGEIAAALADPSTDPTAGVTGNIRGNPKQMDNYFLLGFQLEIPLGAGGKNYDTCCAFGNGWIRGDGSVPKIGRRGKKKRMRLFR